MSNSKKRGQFRSNCGIIWTIYIHAFQNFLEFNFPTCVLGFFFFLLFYFKFTFLKKLHKVTRHLICLCLFTQRWILNDFGKQGRVSQSFRGAKHSELFLLLLQEKKITKIRWGACEKEVVHRTCQGTEGNSIPSWKATGKKKPKLFRQLFTVFHNMYNAISHNLKFYLPWDLVWTCETNQIPLLQLLQMPGRGPCEIYHTLKISDMTGHFFQMHWETQLSSTHKDQRLGSISVLLSARRLS